LSTDRIVCDTANSDGLVERRQAVIKDYKVCKWFSRSEIFIDGADQLFNDENYIYISIDDIINYLPSKQIWDNWLNNVIDTKELVKQLNNVNLPKPLKPVEQKSQAVTNRKLETKYLVVGIALLILIFACFVCILLIWIYFGRHKFDTSFSNLISSYPINDFQSKACIADSKHSTIRLKLISFDEVILTKQSTIPNNQIHITSIQFDSRLEYRDDSTRWMHARNETCVPVSIENRKCL
jgi:hypothetical protein